MAKRNKAKFASKSRKSALRVEALEQRQLLAAVTGSGTEVGSNIVHPNGNVYDQVLMTGSSVTVTADPGQVTRVSFLDPSGDIVQTEFAGAGTLTISLDATTYKAAAEATTYAQPGVKYVTGLPSYTIQGGDATTNFNAFSVGSATAVNQALFTGGLKGGNNVVDAARLVIVANPANPLGSTMGRIGAGNVVFADTSGVVGISATNVNVIGPVIVGDIDASNSGVPTLRFGANSQFATLSVSGGDFVQTNNAAFQVAAGSFQNVNSVAGTNSAGVVSKSMVLPTGTGSLAAAGINTTTLDATTTFDISTMTQADLDSTFKGRTFSSAITINGDLAAANTLSAAEFRGDVTLNGTISGTISVESGIKSLTLAKALAGTVNAQGTVGAITTTGTTNLGGTIRALSVGSVTVGGNMSGVITTDYYTAGGFTFPGTNTNGNTGQYDQNGNVAEKAIGNVAITGNLTGRLWGVLGIGNVTVGGNIATNSNGNYVFNTSAGASGDAFVGNIGTITVTGDVNVIHNATVTTGLINIAARGTFGDITVLGGGTVNNTDLSVPNMLGEIKVVTSLGAPGAKAGAISVTDTASVQWGGTATGGATVNALTIGGGATGTAGAITIKSGGTAATTAAKGNFVTIGAINASNASNGTALSGITVSGAEVITLPVTLTSRNPGAISATTIDTAAATITAPGINSRAVGNISLTASAKSGSTISLGAGNTIQTTSIGATQSDAIGTIDLKAATINWNADVKASKIGAITATGNVNFGTANVGISAINGLTSLAITGNTTFTGSTTVNDAQIDLGGTSGSLTFTGNTTLAGNTFAPSIRADNGLSSLDTIGDITFGGLVSSATVETDIKASAIGNITVTGALATNQALVTKLNVYAGNNGSAGGTDASIAEMVSRAGTNVGSFAIGNISVTSTNTIGIQGTSLFSGGNSFNALGKIGNVTLSAGGSPAVQSSLLAVNTDNLVIQVGNGNHTSNTGAAGGNTMQLVSTGIDFDGNGTVNSITAANTTAPYDTTVTAAIELASTFTAATTVSIGNVSINAKQGTVSNSVLDAGGSAATNDGLQILAGARANGNYAAASILATTGGTMNGSIGTVSVTNLSQQLTANGVQAAYTGIGTPDTGGVIAAVGVAGANSPIGSVNGVTISTTLAAANNAIVIGAAAAAADSQSIVVVRL